MTDTEALASAYIVLDRLNRRIEKLEEALTGNVAEIASLKTVVADNKLLLDDAVCNLSFLKQEVEEQSDNIQTLRYNRNQ